MKNKLLSENAKSAGLIYSIMIAAFVIVSFLVQAILSAIINVKSTAYLAVMQCVSSGVIFAVIIFSKFNGFGLDTKIKVKPLYYGIPLAIMLFLGMFMGLGFINNVIAGWLTGLGLTVSSTSIPLSTPWHLITFVIAIAILPAISEELLFRGLLVRGLNKVKPIYAIFIVSLSFALYHMSLVKFIYQFIFGAMLCLLYYATESIISCMVAHFVNNFTVILSMYLGIVINLNSALIIAIGLVLLAGYVAIVVNLILKKNKQKVQETDEFISSKAEGNSFFLFASFGIFITALMIILSLIPPLQ